MFDFAKVDANYYENAINRFSNLNLQIPQFVNDDEYNSDAISEAIGSNDQRLLGYLQSIGNTTHSLDNMAASTEGLSAYLERTGQMYDTSAIKATLLNSALSGGIILAATLAVKGLSAAWDHFNVTAAEVYNIAKT